jgi:hypothetical protein
MTAKFFMALSHIETAVEVPDELKQKRKIRMGGRGR